MRLRSHELFHTGRRPQKHSNWQLTPKQNFIFKQTIPSDGVLINGEKVFVCRRPVKAKRGGHAARWGLLCRQDGFQHQFCAVTPTSKHSQQKHRTGFARRRCRISPFLRSQPHGQQDTVPSTFALPARGCGAVTLILISPDSPPRASAGVWSQRVH